MITAGGNTTCVSNKRRNLSSARDDHLQKLSVVDQRQQRRMLSNRESARRSRERKQAKFDGLLAEIDRLRYKNKQIFEMMVIGSREYTNLLGENKILNAQRYQLQRKLSDFYEIICSVGYSNSHGVSAQPGMVYYAEPNFVHDHYAQPSVAHYTEPSIVHDHHHAQPQLSIVHHTELNTVQFEDSNPLTVEDYLNDADTFSYPVVNEPTIAPANDTFML